MEEPRTKDGVEPLLDEITRLFAHPGVDWPTLGLCVLMWTGLVVNFWWASAIVEWTLAAALVHIALGTFFLNMSFTIWHEAAHGTVFKSRLANDILGVIGAWPAMLPYFTVRRDHVLHHEHVNDPERDPDFWFLEGSIWSLPLRYPSGVKRALKVVDRAGSPEWEKRADRASFVLVVIAIVLGAWLTSPLVVLTTWLLPKGFAMWIHAWYVNVLPHRGLPAERYLDTRIVVSRWLTPLMLCHNYHGIHHVWMTVPWHRYPKVFRAKRSFLEDRKVPIRGGFEAQ